MSLSFPLLSASHSPTLLETCFILAFPFLFIGMWLLITWIISRSGWVRFARAYACPARPVGTVYRAPYVLFGGAGARYNNAVNAIASSDGLYLRAVILFSTFHTPFLLPWSSIARVERLNGWFIKGWLLHIQDPAGSFKIRFKASFESELRRFAPSLMDSPTPAPPPSIP